MGLPRVGISRKGFLHIVEIVIVTLVVFVLVAQFNSVPPPPSDWSQPRLRLLAQDALFALNAKNANLFNVTEIGDVLGSFFGGAGITYTLTIKNTAKSLVYVGCACNDSDVAKVKQALSNFSINGNNVTFQVMKINDSYSNTTFPLEQDVVILRYQNLTNHTQAVRNFLRTGRGIVSIRNFNSSSVDPTYNAYYGIDWDNDLSPAGTRTHFSPLPNSSYYSLKRYFQSLPVFYDDFTEQVQGKWTTSGTWSWSKHYYTADTGANTHYSAYGGPVLENFSARANITVETAYGTTDCWGGIGIRYNNFTQDRYVLYLDSAGNVQLYNVSGTIYKSLATVATGLSAGPHFLKLEANGTLLNAYVDGEMKKNLSQFPITSGQISLEANGSKSRFDDARMTLTGNLEQPLVDGEKVNLTDHEFQRVILRESSGVAAMVAKDHAADFRGRTVWISEPVQEWDTRFGNLLRSAVVWASGETAKPLVDISSSAAAARAVIYKIFTQDMYQPVEIILELSYAF